jgi:hypothetical protein
MAASGNGSTKWVLGIAAVIVTAFMCGAVAWGYSVARDIAATKVEVIYMGKMVEPIAVSLDRQREVFREHLINPDIHGSGIGQIKVVLEETNKRLQRIESKIDSGM